MNGYTGITWLRQSLAARRNSVAIAKELQVSKILLEDFEAERRIPPEKVLKALASFLTGGYGEYDAELDLMRSTNRNEPTSMGIKPPPFVAPKVEYVVGGFNQMGPQPVLKPGAKPKPKPVASPRPGWV